MRHEFALDHLCTYDVETADPQRLKPNSQLKGMKKQLGMLQGQLTKLQARYVKVDLKQAKDAARKTDTLVHEIQQIEQAIKDHKAQVKAMSQRVAVGETLEPQHVVQLETERKSLTDVIKMIAYRTENALLPQVTLAHSSALDEGRAFLKAVFQTPVDLLPCEQRKQLVVRFHSMTHPRFNKGLHGYANARLYSEQFTTELICEWSMKGQLSHINPDYVTSSEISQPESISLFRSMSGSLKFALSTPVHLAVRNDAHAIKTLKISRFW